MFTTISWGSYLIAVSTVLFLWYLYLGFRFYSIELKQVLLGHRKISFPFSGKRKIIDSLTAESVKVNSMSSLSESYSESFATLDEVKEISARIIDATAESAERNLSRVEFQNFLKLIFSEYPYVKISSLRSTINDLTVSESQKHTSLALSVELVEDLWNETV
jgi:hypothetical protein